MREKLLKLTNDWYEYVSNDHHKDCDCHWRITEDWEYGGEPVYVASHEGYVFDGDYITCKTYDDALKALVGLVEKAFREEAKWAKQIIKKPEDWDDTQKEKAKFLQDKGWLDS